MIVVDTSVWVDATRHPNGTSRRTLEQLIDADEVALALPVRLELVAGLNKRDRPAFVRALAALPLLVPTEDTWRLIEGWVPRAADQGYRFAVTDLLIAGLAHEISALIWSRDADFARMEALNLARCY